MPAHTVPLSGTLVVTTDESLRDRVGFQLYMAEQGQTGEKEDAKCSVIPLVLDYLYTGQPDQAWAELYRLYPYPDVETLRAEIEEA